MNIVFIEPFYSGSHRSWLNQWVKISSHQFNLLTMDGKFWKWRMYGAAFTMAEKFHALTKEYLASNTLPDIILASDMLDLAVFIALVKNDLNQLGNPPVGVYFHENQLAYPWKENSEDVQEKRDVHYGMMNYNSLLCADFAFFNSNHNRDSFMDGLEGILNKMPDYRHNTLDHLVEKSYIMPIGIPAPDLSFKADINRPPLILWNHRLEYDKNPQAFFETLIRLKNDNIPFTLALLGEMNSASKKDYGKYIKALEDHIVSMGFKTAPEYHEIMTRADLLPVTSNHDFFGISIMEAVSYGTVPLLPKRLTYPELYQMENNPELFYDDLDDLYEKLKWSLIHIDEIRSRNYSHLAEPYYWKTLNDEYDWLLNKVIRR